MAVRIINRGEEKIPVARVTASRPTGPQVNEVAAVAARNAGRHAPRRSDPAGRKDALHPVLNGLLDRVERVLARQHAPQGATVEIVRRIYQILPALKRRIRAVREVA